MAKSFHTIIDEGCFEVEHLGDLVTLELPDMFQDLKSKTEDVEFLRSWVRDNGIELAVYQCALQKRIIELRAIARSTVKKFKDHEIFDKEVKKITEPDDWNIDRKNLELSLKIIADPKAQDRLDQAKWTPVERPGTGGKNAIKLDTQIETIAKTIGKMLDRGDSVEEIKSLYDGAFSTAVLAKAINLAQAERE